MVENDDWFSIKPYSPVNSRTGSAKCIGDIVIEYFSLFWAKEKDIIKKRIDKNKDL